MAEGWFEGAVLGRYGDIGDYAKDNCRWQTKSESVREMVETNGKNNYWLPDGRPGATVAVENGVSREAFRRRVVVHGWSIEDAWSIPVGGSPTGRQKLSPDDVRWARLERATNGTTFAAIAEALGVTKQSVMSAVKGLSFKWIDDTPPCT